MTRKSSLNKKKWVLRDLPLPTLLPPFPPLKCVIIIWLTQYYRNFLALVASPLLHVETALPPSNRWIRLTPQKIWETHMGDTIGLWITKWVVVVIKMYKHEINLINEPHHGKLRQRSVPGPYWQSGTMAQLVPWLSSLITNSTSILFSRDPSPVRRNGKANKGGGWFHN